MKIGKIALTATAAALIAAPLAACGNDSATSGDSTSAATSATGTEQAGATPSQILSSTAWKTTGAVDQNGTKLPLDDKNVTNYVGFAYFHPDGTFEMFTLDDAPKMHGDWTVSPDGKTRTIVAKDAAGTVQFTRESQITELTGSTFTYRTYPDEKNKSVYIDIVHTPTTHPQPAA